MSNEFNKLLGDVKCSTVFKNGDFIMISFQGREHSQTALSNYNLEVLFRIIPKKILSSIRELGVVSEHFRLYTFGSYLNEPTTFDLGAGNRPAAPCC